MVRLASLLLLAIMSGAAVAPGLAAAAEPTAPPTGDDGYNADYGYPTPSPSPSPTPSPSPSPSESPPPPNLPVTGAVGSLAVAGVGLVLVGFGILTWVLAGRRGARI